ncbi:hypothetical protein R3X25_10060 [Lutibacter sp. TH_r2]|uniref:hypothetical protein n=1 Tax=Lutibacter sp. TH_r2 TaxID=3082083 RepID=UPI002954CE02|nr:hypothetical protein [Lutibacter sp. TH_r2]MDV7187624.1 hypothetical protein [Lutibacter sp. TH_r2]
MKKLLLIIVFVFPFIIYSQFKIDTLNSEGSFSKVYDIKLSKEQLHQKALEWIAINFKDSNEVIKLNTKEKVIAKGYFDIDIISNGYKFKQKVYSIIEVAFKESKYKLDFHTFIIETSIQGKIIKTPYNQSLACLNRDSYISFLKQVINVNPTNGLVSDKKIRKTYTKILNSPKLIDEYMEKGLIFEKQYTTQIKNNVEGLAEHMFSYISKKSKDDW